MDVGFTSDGPWNPASGATSWSYSWTPPAPGAYTIYARARDQAGNVTATEPATVTVVGPPSLAILTPSDGGMLLDAPISLTGTAGVTAATVEVAFSADGPWSPADGTTNWTFTWNPPAPGSYSIYARATDAVGNVIVSAPTHATLIGPPSVSIALPPEGIVLAPGPFTIQGSAVSSGSTVTSIDVAFDSGGPWYSATGSSSWSFLWTPETPGAYTLYARATDALGDTGMSAPVSAVVAAPPTVSITAPAVGDLLPLSSSTIRGTASSADSTVASVDVALDENGPWMRASGTVNWAFSWTPPAAGSYALYARATDAVGNVAVGPALPVSVPSPPAVAITAPSAGAALPLAPFTITGTADSSATTIAGVEVAFGSAGPWSAADGTANWNFTWSPPAGGNFTLYARATDALGNVVVGAPVSFLLTTPPAVSTTVPGNGGVLGLAPSTFAGTTSSEHATVASVEVAFASAGPWSAADGTTDWTYTWQPPAPGAYTLWIRATDTMGNVTVGATTSFTVAAPPTVAITSPPPSGLLAQSGYTIRGNASSAASSVVLVEVAFQADGPWSAAAGTSDWSYAWTPPGAGPYTLYPRATDAVGNVAVGSPVTFRVAAPPTVVVTAPADGSTFSWGPYAIAGTAASSDSSVTAVEVAFSPDGPWLAAAGSTSWSYAWTPVSAIPYTIYARATDAVGNVAVSPGATVTVTPPPPETIAFYKSQFDAEYLKDKATLNSLAAKGDGATYYNFSYILDATLSMFEATNDTTYLERALTWAETMISKATIIDVKGDRNWKGTWSTPSIAAVPISYNLHDLQGSTELARLARIIFSSSALKATYGNRGLGVYNFVRDDILNKWLFDRGHIAWYHNVTADTQICLNDKVALHVRILRDVSLASTALGNSDNVLYNYPGMLADLAVGIRDHWGKKNRFEPYGGGLIWDRNLGWYGPIPPQTPDTALDTSHANRYPRMLADLYEVGCVFGLEYVLGVNDLLKKVIWNQSYLDPRFNNLIDGQNYTINDRGPWADGQIYSGWVCLANYDDETLRIANQAYKNLLAGKMNPSLGYMNSIYGRLELPAALAKAVALRSAAP